MFTCISIPFPLSHRLWQKGAFRQPRFTRSLKCARSCFVLSRQTESTESAHRPWGLFLRLWLEEWKPVEDGHPLPLLAPETGLLPQQLALGYWMGERRRLGAKVHDMAWQQRGNKALGFMDPADPCPEEPSCSKRRKRFLQTEGGCGGYGKGGLDSRQRPLCM